MKKIRELFKKAIFQYKNLSILNKFLLSPIIALTLFFPFYTVVFISIASMNSSINGINNDSIPVYELSSENLLLLESISNQVSGAVDANEKEWIEFCDKSAKDLKNNLLKYQSSKYSNEIQSTIEAFDRYYFELKRVSTKILLNNQCYPDIDKDTYLLVERYNKIHNNLKDLKYKSKNDIQDNINNFYNETNFLFIQGSIILFIVFVVSVFVIYLVYRDIKIRINKIVSESKKIAQADIDFKNRLETESCDEIGDIVKSINIFVDKLHKNHLNLLNAKDELEGLYITDRLTGVYNRVKIDEIIDIELSKKRRYDVSFSIILIDIDHFKKINDTYGHIIGDNILKEFASILKSNIRNSDFVGRWGGEEFIVISTYTEKKSAISIAEHLRAKIKGHNFSSVHNISASFGITVSNSKDNIESIIDRADKALYEAKNSGRDRVCTV